MGWTDKLAEMLRLNDGEQAYTGYPQMQVGLNKPRQAGYATGFLEGATGVEPMQSQGVLTNPNYDQYAKGKNIGEAVGIGAMAVPGYAMALRASAPKAYNALENYMVKSGGMIPLEAYHGTPHTIKGQFDINKVGTGEGNQSFGHGMYFAEAKPVAEGYRHMLSVDRNVASENIKFDTLKKYLPKEAPSVQREINGFINGDGGYNDFVRIVNEQGSKGLKNALLKEEPNLFNAGNLYKVDIPNEHIPKMLDWDNPVPEELRQRISKATMEKFGNGATGTSGEHLYNEIVFEMRRNGSKTPEADASKWLHENDVPGIKYLDYGSRSSKDAKTSNFVVFDPSTVKILEENGKALSRKELIEKQVKSLKE